MDFNSWLVAVLYPGGRFSRRKGGIGHVGLGMKVKPTQPFYLLLPLVSQVTSLLLLFMPFPLLLSSRFPNFPTTNTRSDRLHFPKVTKLLENCSFLTFGDNCQVLAPTGRPGRAEEKEAQLLSLKKLLIIG